MVGFNPNVLAVAMAQGTPVIAHMDASVKKIGTQYCVTHSTTGQVLKRKGRRACYKTRAKAQADANATRCRIMGDCRR